jgi:hypothetical protein
VLLLGATLILAGCGGSGAAKQQFRVVQLSSFRFEVPVGWAPTVGKDRYSAKHGSDFVQAEVFTLVHPYKASLFAKVEPELAARMAAVAKQTGGTVSGSTTVVAGGIKSHSYDVQVGKGTDAYTFVLRGMHELQLICSADDAVCSRLLSSVVVRAS